MKQYTTLEQTTKMIELGFEKPKGWYVDGVTNHINLYVNIDENPMMFNYSIGELIEMLPKHIEIKSQWCRLDIYPTKNKWHINYDNIGFEGLAKTYETELIDALYNMIVKLKEEEVI